MLRRAALALAFLSLMRISLFRTFDAKACPISFPFESRTIPCNGSMGSGVLDETMEDASRRLFLRRDFLPLELRRELEGSGRGVKSIILISYFCLGNLLSMCRHEMFAARCHGCSL
eukprot:scaffold21117_cov21-Cyclotella_meneghiniana.AAC.1